MTVRAEAGGIFRVDDRSIRIRLASVVSSHRLEGHPDVLRFFLTYTENKVQLSALYYVYFKSTRYEKDGAEKLTDYAASILVQKNGLFRPLQIQVQNTPFMLDQTKKAEVMENLRDAFVAYYLGRRPMLGLQPTPAPRIIFEDFRDGEPDLYDRLIEAVEK